MDSPSVGDPAAARDALAQALDRLDRLAAEQGMTWQLRRDMAFVRMRLGSVLDLLGDHDAALRHLREAIPAFEACQREAPESARSIVDLIDADSHLAQILTRRSDDEGRREEFATAAALTERVLRDQAGDPSVQECRPALHQKLGYLRLNLGDTAGAREVLTRLCDVLEGRHAEHPSDASVSLAIANAQQTLVACAMREGDAGATAEAGRKAASHYRWILERDPSNADVVYSLVYVTDMVGQAFCTARRWEEALAPFTEMSLWLGRLPPALAESADIVRRRLICLANLGECQASLDRLDEAEESLRAALVLARSFASKGTLEDRRLLMACLEYLATILTTKARREEDSVRRRRLLQEAVPAYDEALRLFEDLKTAGVLRPEDQGFADLVTPKRAAAARRLARADAEDG
jgi:tetratricopeptide (TPR) repeat protein